MPKAKQELKKLNNKKIGILGLGIENYAMVKYLLKYNVKAEFTICDARSKEQLGEKFKELNKFKNIKWRLGEEYNKRLYEFDILFRSPGWPLACPGIAEFKNLKKQPASPAGRKSKKAGDLIYSPMKLFFDLCPTKNIIGVTGTKGKGTTSSLIYEMLKIGKKRVWLGGNIGVAPFAFLPKIKKNDWVVLEISSFQLEDMGKSPRIAVITNFYKDHLAPADPNNPNYHQTMRDYLRAKMNIARWQGKRDYSIINYQLSIINFKFSSKVIYFGKSELPSKLIGEHNKENIAAAVAVAKIIGIKEKNIAKAVANFKGLEHRLEFVREVNKVKFYNDSFATTPESSITALKSFKAPIILLVGGADKKADFSKLAKEIKKRVKYVILLEGKLAKSSTPMIRKELLKIGFPAIRMKKVDNIKDAVKKARVAAEPGDIALLSTACASFDMFRNYKERGKLFKKEVKRLK